jgi:hypothetical protein
MADSKKNWVSQRLDLGHKYERPNTAGHSAECLPVLGLVASVATPAEACAESYSVEESRRPTS